jgi:hypothetical protein
LGPVEWDEVFWTVFAVFCDHLFSNQVDWENEMECFETFAAAMADFYAMHPPLLPNPNGDELSQAYYDGKGGNPGHGECP